MPEIDRWENEGGRVSQAKPSSRLRALQRRIDQLDMQIDAESNRPKSCSKELRRLRKEQLFLKDEMSEISA